MKKLNKFFAVLVALAMVLSLTAISAFAATDKTGTKDNAYLTKYLRVADGVNLPSGLTFTFKADKVSDSAYPGDKSKMLEATDVTIPVSTMVASATEADNAAALTGKALVSKFFENKTWDHAGVYTYDVYEDAAAITEGANEEWNFSQKHYTLRVYVTNNNTVTYTVQDGTGAADDEKKVDPTVQDPTAHDNTTTEETIELDGFYFDNSYAKTLNNTSEDGLLKVSKTIAGDYANTKQAFPFTIVLTIPAEATEFTSVTDYTVNGVAGEAVAVSGNKATITGNLADGGTIVFHTLPAGTKYTVTEALTGVENADKWAQAYTLTDIGDETETPAETPGASTNGTVAETDTKNIAAFKNTYTDSSTTTPTGILISNLPYIALALVAIGGLVAYVVVRRRQSDEA